MRRLHDLALALACLAILVGSLVLVPRGHGLSVAGGRALPSACWVSEAIGHPCPCCGLTRSCVAFARGNVAEALRLHPAGPIISVEAAMALAAVIAFGVTRAAPLWGRRSLDVGLAVACWSCLVGGLVREILSR